MGVLRGGSALAAALAAAVALAPTGARAQAPPEFVLSPEGNHLWAYDATTGDHQLVARAENGGDPGGDPDLEAPNGIRRDINGQVCVSPDRTHVVTGEDTVVGGGSSHDPDIAGWGYFTITGSTLGSIAIDQVGKLSPGDGYAGDPDNYGCAFLDDDRLLTTAIGDPFPGQPANGQLFLWFGPFDAGHASGVGGYVGDVEYCVIDATLATAGGIAVDGDDVYVATNRPSDFVGGEPSGVWRYSGPWPTSGQECAPKEPARVIPAVDGVLADPHVPTPSAVAVSPAGTLYVSSVFSGTVSEFSSEGAWIRDVFPLSPVTPMTGPTTQTPFGIAVAGDGSLWIADLGILVAEPAPGQGSVIRVRFDDGDPVLPAETVRDGLSFPDGLGVYAPLTGPSGPSPVAPDDARGTAVESATADVPRSTRSLPATGGALGLVLPAALLALALVVRPR